MATTDTYIWTDGLGNSININDLTNYLQLPPDGFGTSEGLELVSRRTPYGTGSTWVYTRVPEKEVVLHFWLRASSWNDQLAKRRALAAAFSPARGLGTLAITFADGSQRSLACLVAGGPAFGAKDARGISRTVHVKLSAPSGLWYDPTTPVLSIPLLGSSGTANTMPVTLPYTPTSTAFQSPGLAVATNNGNYQDFPLISIPGPAVNPTLRNQTTQLYLRANTTVPSGSTLTFDCSYTNPQVSVTDAYGNVSTIWQRLDSGSTFFAITPGANTLVYTQDNQTSNTVSVTFYSRYTGV